MQSRSNTSPSPSPERPASPTDGNKAAARSLSNRTLRIPRKSAKPEDASPDDHHDLDVPLRELLALNVDESVRAGRLSNKIKLRLKRIKPSEASTLPTSPICLFCLRHFHTRTDLLHHLQMQHSSTEEQVHDHEQGEDNGAEKKSEEDEGSSAATDQARNDGLDLNHHPIEQVLVSAENSGDKSGDDTIDGPRKKIRFDLNELPPDQDEHENQP